MAVTPRTSVFVSQSIGAFCSVRCSMLTLASWLGQAPRMRARKVAMLVAGAMWAAFAIRLGAVWERLPARMATHFGPSGAADGWMTRTGFVLFSVVVGGGVTSLLLSGGSWLRLVPPEMVNLPYASYWMAPERREAGLRRVGDWMAWFGVLLAAMMVAVDELVLRANLGGDVALNGRLFTGLLLGFLTLVAGWLAAFYWRLRPPRAS
jgi:uncharacterized membrane protein